MVFATHEFSGADLFKRLTPNFTSSEDDEFACSNQHRMFEALRIILEKWAKHDRTLLHWFCEFVTGQKYLNTDPRSTFTITVDFDLETDDSLPESHTCVDTISFPISAYNGDIEVTEEKIKKAVQSCHQTYMMT